MGLCQSARIEIDHDRVGTVLDGMKLAPFDADTQETGFTDILHLCTNPFDGDVTTKYAGGRGVIHHCKFILERYIRKELVLRACITLLAHLATDVDNCEIMRTIDIVDIVSYIRDDEFDDEWIQADAKKLFERLREGGIKAGRKRLDDARLEESCHSAVHAMFDYPKIIEVQREAMDFIDKRVSDPEQMETMLEAGGLEAMVSIFKHHQKDEALIMQTLNLIYKMARSDENLSIQFGKKEGIHPLCELMRQFIDQRSGDMIQLLWHVMAELCKVSRNAERFNNRRACDLIDATEANVRHKHYTRQVHVPWKLKKILEPLGAPEAKAADMGLVDENELTEEERTLLKLQRELEELRYKAHGKPKSRLEEEKLKMVIASREAIKQKRADARKLELAQRRRENERLVREGKEPIYHDPELKAERKIGGAS